MNLEKFLEDYRFKGEFPLTSQQKDYIRDCVEGVNHVANWSNAGTGKSVCLEALKEYLGDELIICATTGIANSILFNNRGGDGTMHKVFSVPPAMHNTNNSKIKSYTSGLFGGSDLVKYVIIEEAGMLNPDQLDLISKRITSFNKPRRGKREARSIKLILQGDFLQLLPVIDDRHEKPYLRQKYGSELLFESKPYKDLKFNVHVFTNVMRTNDKVFKACLDVMRYGQEDRYPKALQWVNKFYRSNIPEGLPFITTTNKKVDIANEAAVNINSNPAYEYVAEISGKFNMKDCPASKRLILKKGLPVITLVNSPEGLYSNGSFGYVEDCLEDGCFINFPATGETHFVEVSDFEQRESFVSEQKNDNGEVESILDSKVVGRAKVLGVKVAAAFSIHRMQGRTLDVPAVVDLGYYGFDMNPENEWGINMCYVACSRFVRPEDMYLKYPLKHDTVKGKTHIKSHRKAIEYLSQFISKGSEL